ncbi:unnamed protein product [Caenorhabditis sp. 36 PRJEB53466]|nr:unnamed protein product [Caenorhabditis sp. 36 PRJEB53466]
MYDQKRQFLTIPMPEDRKVQVGQWVIGFNNGSHIDTYTGQKFANIQVVGEEVIVRTYAVGLHSPRTSPNLRRYYGYTIWTGVGVVEDPDANFARRSPSLKPVNVVLKYNSNSVWLDSQFEIVHIGYETREHAKLPRIEMAPWTKDVFEVTPEQQAERKLLGQQKYLGVIVANRFPDAASVNAQTHNTPKCSYVWTASIGLVRVIPGLNVLNLGIGKWTTFTICYEPSSLIESEKDYLHCLRVDNTTCVDNVLPTTASSFLELECEFVFRITPEKMTDLNSETLFHPLLGTVEISREKALEAATAVHSHWMFLLKNEPYGNCELGKVTLIAKVRLYKDWFKLYLHNRNRPIFYVESNVEILYKRQPISRA